jgi:hypothetical protein
MDGKIETQTRMFTKYQLYFKSKKYKIPPGDKDPQDDCAFPGVHRSKDSTVSMCLHFQGHLSIRGEPHTTPKASHNPKI